MGELQEKCGIFGVYGANMEAARLTHSGLWALQHRGQESSGIASTEGTTIRVIKDEGLVAHVYDEDSLALLSGHCAIGHNRYGTSGGSGKQHAQPILGEKRILALSHNGNLPQTAKLENFLDSKGIERTDLNDSEMMHAALEYFLEQGIPLHIALKRAFPLFTGVFCLVGIYQNSLFAVRDAMGVRPLCLGKLNGGYIISSETCALDTIGANFIRDIAPGEMVVIDGKGITSYKIAKGQEKLDIFEFVYFARPDSMLLGKRVGEVRKNLGKYLAKECKLDLDVIIPVPDSAIPAALGYSQESGISFDHGLIKNRYIHRTFIRPAQKLREKDVEMKLNPIPEIIEGKRIAIVDDSLVRGTTAKKLVERLRRIGAKEVHLLISCPPVLYPDFYGINTPNQKDLLAARLSIPEMTKYLDINSLHFLSYKGMIEAIGIAEDKLTTSCFTGIYPVQIGEREREVIDKSLQHIQ